MSAPHVTWLERGELACWASWRWAGSCRLCVHAITLFQMFSCRGLRLRPEGTTVSERHLSTLLQHVVISHMGAFFICPGTFTFTQIINNEKSWKMYIFKCQIKTRLIRLISGVVNKFPTDLRVRLRKIQHWDPTTTQNNNIVYCVRVIYNTATLVLV